MNRRLVRFAVLYPLLVFALLPLLTVTTKYLYSTLEGEEISYAQGFIFVMQTLTTTGYGELLPFESWGMSLYASGVMLLGLFLVFIAIATIAGEWFQSHLEETPPLKVSSKTSDHIVICGYGPLVEDFHAELAERPVRTVLICADLDTARQIWRDRHPVVYGDPSEGKVLERAGVQRARALVIHGTSAEAVNVVLQARHLTSAPLVAAVEEEEHIRTLEYAGASKAVSPKTVLGEELARWAVASLPEAIVARARELGDLSMSEFPVCAHSPFEGQTLAESGLRDRTGVTILGFWDEGVFRPVRSPRERLRRGLIAVAVGTREQLEQLSGSLAYPPRWLEARGERYVVAGAGDVGRHVVDTLLQEGKTDIVLIDRVPEPGQFPDGVQVVRGDATAEGMLDAAGLPDAHTYIVVLEEDSNSVFSTLVARRLNPNLRIVARANSHQAVDRLYRSGADFALSLSQVGARILLGEVLDEEAKQVPDHDIEFVEFPVSERLRGQSIADLRIYSATGCLVVALKDDDSVVANPPAHSIMEAGHRLVVLGHRDDLERFRELFSD